MNMLWNTISKQGVQYASQSTEQLKRQLNIPLKKKYSRSHLINTLLINQFGKDTVTKFNNMSKVVQDYYSINTKKMIQKKPL